MSNGARAMPGTLEIMREVRAGLDALPVDRRASDAEWTRAIKTELCKIGRRFRCKVGARKSEVDEGDRDFGEWLFDVRGSKAGTVDCSAHPWPRSANGAASRLSRKTPRNFYSHGRPSD